MGRWEQIAGLIDRVRTEGRGGGKICIREE